MGSVKLLIYAQYATIRMIFDAATKSMSDKEIKKKNVRVQNVRSRSIFLFFWSTVNESWTICCNSINFSKVAPLGSSWSNCALFFVGHFAVSIDGVASVLSTQLDERMTATENLSYTIHCGPICLSIVDARNSYHRRRIKTGESFTEIQRRYQWKCRRTWAQRIDSCR